MSEREQRCATLIERLSAKPLEQWEELYVAFYEEGFLPSEIALAIECHVTSALIGFLSNLKPRGLRAAAAATMLKIIGDGLQDHEDIKGGHDA